MNKFGYACSLYGHFGDGCIHTRIDFGLKNKNGIEKYQPICRAKRRSWLSVWAVRFPANMVTANRKRILLPIMFGEELVEAFREFKKIWDPENKMNPGKVVNAFHNDENLRLGTNYNPWQPQTKFFYGEDNGNFAESLCCVALAWANVVAAKAGRCARATWSRARKNIRLAARARHAV